jgi:hypothetical protein
MRIEAKRHSDNNFCQSIAAAGTITLNYRLNLRQG